MSKEHPTPQERYKAKNARYIKIDLLKTTDADILSKLDSVPNKTGYIKALIRADISKNGQQP